jgi:hypothetical protein
VTADDPLGIAGLVAADPWDAICDAWVGDQRDASTTRSVSSDVPVVAIGAGVDPFHSPASMTEGMRDLSGGVIRTAPWAPEGATGPCVTAGATAWLDDPRASLPADCPLVTTIPFADAP